MRRNGGFVGRGAQVKRRAAVIMQSQVVSKGVSNGNCINHICKFPFSKHRIKCECCLSRARDRQMTFWCISQTKADNFANIYAKTSWIYCPSTCRLEKTTQTRILERTIIFAIKCLADRGEISFGLQVKHIYNRMFYWVEDRKSG